MSEKMGDKKRHKSEKHREETTELKKDEKELQKAKKKKDRVVNNDRKANKVVEALKTTCVKGKENVNRSANGCKNLVDCLEEKKEKTKRDKEEKKKKKKDGVDGISSLGENFEDDKMDELLKGRGDKKNCQENPVVNYEVERTEKKKKKKEEEEEEEEGVGGISSSGENVDDGKMDDLVKERGYSKNFEDIPVVNSEIEWREKKKKKKKKKEGADVVDGEVERAEKKKKRKREMEDDDNVIKNNVIDVQQLSEERNYSDRKINEGRKLVVKGKNTDEVSEYNEIGEVAKAQKGTKSGDVVEMNDDKEVDKSAKKKKKRKSENASGDIEESIVDKPGTESTRVRDGKKKEYKDDVRFTEDKLHEGKKSFGEESNKKAKSAKLGKEDDSGKDKKKKVEAEKRVSDGIGHKGKPRTKKDTETTDKSENPTSQGKSKRVSFSDPVEVFSSDGRGSRKSKQVEGLVRGKRFTQEENEKVKEAVLGYIEERGLGDKGLDMVLNCRSYPEIKNCWKQIAASLPWRPRESVYYRAHILFERDENRKWTPEEYEYILKYYKEHGSDWKKLSKLMNKHRWHVKDTFRRIRFTNLNKGRWSQEEYQNLFDLVNKDIRMRASEEKKSKHGMLRDNVCWGAISEKLSSRHNAACCLKWYNQLTSSMVAEGLWADTDDYRLLDALSELDAACTEDVDWDNLLEHREGDLCRKRWRQMVKHIGEYGNKSFCEQVEILSNRYSLDVLEAREEYDSKEPVDVIVNNLDDSAL